MNIVLTKNLDGTICQVHITLSYTRFKTSSGLKTIWTHFLHHREPPAEARHFDCTFDANGVLLNFSNPTGKIGIAFCELPQNYRISVAAILESLGIPADNAFKSKIVSP